MNLTTADLDRFWSRVVKTETCWQWTGKLDNGYGRFWAQRMSLLAHRVAYESAHGPLPADQVLDHLCRNRGCVNPAHLELVTNAENVLRGIGLSATNKRKTLCHRGHPLNGSNLLTYSGRRGCRECQVQRVRDWRARKAS